MPDIQACAFKSRGKSQRLTTSHGVDSTSETQMCKLQQVKRYIWNSKKDRLPCSGQRVDRARGGRDLIVHGLHHRVALNASARKRDVEPGEPRQAGLAQVQLARHRARRRVPGLELVGARDRVAREQRRVGHHRLAVLVAVPAGVARAGRQHDMAQWTNAQQGRVLSM